MVDDEEAVFLPSDPGPVVVLLRHLTGPDYELVDGSRGVFSKASDRSGQAMTRIMTRRADLLPAGSVIPAKTPSPDVTAASVSFDQLRDIVNRLSTAAAGDEHRTDGPSPRFVTNAEAVDRKTIVERLAESADRLVSERVGQEFFREHLTRDANSERVQRPRSLNPGEAPEPEGRWYGIAFAYRLRAFGSISKSTAATVVIGLDGSLLAGADRLPDCRRQPGACAFNIDESAAKRIAQDHGLEQGSTPWSATLHWEPSCRAFVWSIMNYISRQESRILLVTTGSGQVCGEESVITTSCGGPPPPQLEPPPPNRQTSRPPP